jgi:predicted RNA-binding Zn-ribbon protein involved in translation (DUF1610 family)
MLDQHRFNSPPIINKETIHCPNCGNHALRQEFLVKKELFVETSCPVCDYLLIHCQRTGRVLDSYLYLVKNH